MLTAVSWILDNIFSIVVTVNSDYGMTYFITALFPLVLAGLIYRNQGYGTAGFMRCMLLTAVFVGILLCLPQQYNPAGNRQCGEGRTFSNPLARI